MNPSAESTSHWWVICLCAEWCGVCREWREVFGQAAAAHPGMRFAWVDVEDEAEAMGEVDIETFPTILIAREDRPLFLGPVVPSSAQLKRLIASLADGHAVSSSSVTAEAVQLLSRLATVLPRNS